MVTPRWTFPSIVVLLTGCAGSPPSASEEPRLVEQARRTASGLMKTLAGELNAAIGSGGPAEAIAVCKQKAPQIAADVSKSSGMTVKRVSDRNRNPRGVPDAWEAKALARLVQRRTDGEPGETLETHAIVDGPEGRTFRYAKALVTNGLCLTCHGKPDAIPEAVQARLAQEYPEDRARGYDVGMVRGIISITKPL
jgi:hypothetical protein